MRRLLLTLPALCAGGALAACGITTGNPMPSTTPRSTSVSPAKHGCRAEAFTIDNVSMNGGYATPVAAARAFARQPKGVTTCPLPLSGWTLVSHDAHFAEARSGDVTLRAMRGNDGTWKVDSGIIH